MTFRKLGLLGLTVVAGILAACDGETVVVPPPPDTTPDIVLTVVPDTATLFINGTRQLSAVVTGTTNQAVTWTSSSDAIATVSATGLVTGRAVGAAIVTAVSTADGRARDAATINVIAVPTASIVITNVTQGGAVVAPTNLSGSIEVNAELNVPQGAQVQRIEFLLDNVVQANCTQTFQSGGSADLEVDEAMVPVVCAINTAAFNAATGAPTFPNGPHRISAQVVSPAGTVVASSSQDLGFNNTNMVRVTLTPERTANGATGLAWVGGTLGVTAIPTLYTGGNVSSVTVVVDDTTGAPGGTAVGPVARTQSVTAAGPVTITFPTSGSNSLAGIEDANTLVTVNTTIGGNAGPSANQRIRLDEVAPTVGGALTFPAGSNNWVGPNVTIASMTTGTASTQNPTPFVAVDTGVNVVVKSVQWKTASAGTSAFATVNAIGDLAETGTNVDLDFRGRACDALNNCANISSQDGGVDKTPPTNVMYIAPSPANQAILAASATFVINGSDGLSGPNDFLATLQRLGTSGSTACVVPATSGTCNRGSSLTNTFSTGTTEGYYTFGGGADGDLVFRDQALNTTSIAGRTVVRDITSPAVQNIVLPATLPSGGSATFTATATDNLDINASIFRVRYALAPDTAELSYAGPTQVGAFGAPLLQSSPLTATVNFIRSVEMTTAAPGNAPTGTLMPAIAARFDVSDFGGNMASAFNNFASGTVPVGSSATALGVFDWFGQVPAGSPTTICDSQGSNPCTAPTATSTNLVGIARGMSGTFAAPFARVIFYINNGGVRTFLGETTVRSSTDTGVSGDVDGRVWTYGPVTFSGAGRGAALPGNTYNIEAVGVDSSGDALVSQFFTVTVVTN